MRTWSLAKSLLCCWKCQAWIEKGQPYQLVHLPGLKNPKVRCRDCAEGPVPENMDTSSFAELPAKTASGPLGLTRLGSVAQRFDVRAAQARSEE